MVRSESWEVPATVAKFPAAPFAFRTCPLRRCRILLVVFHTVVHGSPFFARAVFPRQMESAYDDALGLKVETILHCRTHKPMDPAVRLQRINTFRAKQVSEPSGSFCSF